VISYLEAAPRPSGTKDLLNRIIVALGDMMLADIDQEAIDRARKKMLRPDAAPATVLRNLIVPVRAVMRHAHRRKWCDAPDFEIPAQPEGRTLYLLPAEAERLVAAAAPHLKPLILFLLGTGARMSQAIDLGWREVDLRGARVALPPAKRQPRRIVTLRPRLLAALASLPDREGAVFRWETMRPSKKRGGQPKRTQTYADRGREGGGQIKTGWAGALRRAGLDPALRPHDLRHTWASWHYAEHQDLLALKGAGKWSTVKLVERYAHLMPAGLEAQIAAFWDEANTAAAGVDASA
jgi:integrase